MTSGAYFDVHTYRPLGQGTAQGDFSGWGAAASVKSVFELLIRGDLKISPYAEVKASHVETGSYAESGAGALNMHYEDTETDKLVTAFGVQVDTPPLPVGRSLSIQPALHAAMAYNFLDQAGRADARFTGSAATVFTGEGPERDRASALVGMRFDIQPADTTDIAGYVNYDTEQARDAEHHALMVGLRVRW